MPVVAERPWEELARLIEASDRAAVETFLRELPVTETARAISRLPFELQGKLLLTLQPVDAAGLVDAIPDVQAAGMIERIAPAEAAAILDELQSAERADLLGEITDSHAEAILAEMPPHRAEGTRTLSEYPGDVAGGIMLAEFLAFPRDKTVGDVVEELRERSDHYRDYQVQYVYVTGVAGKLEGVLRLRDLLLAPKRRPIEELMVPEPLTVRDTATLEDLADVFDASGFLAVPVVDAHGAIVGVVRRASFEEALGEKGVSDYRKSQGIVGGEELRTMPLLTRTRRRLSWLIINIPLNLIAASVIAVHQDTLSAVIALAVFLPIISDMSGCSGTQAVAVSIRELTLGLIAPRELGRVLGKEVLLGLLTGTTLGILIAGVAWVWQGSPWLGVVAGAALAGNTLVAVAVGGTIPLILKRFGVDPALASGPILTTITDMSGFLLALTIASAMLPRLIGG